MVLQVIKTVEGRKEAIDTKKLTVLQFSAEWCGPCKIIKPKVEAMSNQDQYNNVNFYYIDIDENGALAAEYGVQSVPSFFILKNGETVHTISGANESALKAAIDKLNI